MGLFDFVGDVVGAVIAAPVAIVYDTVTMGGALTDRKEPMTVSVGKKIAQATEDLIEK